MLYEVVWASGKANEATKARKKEMRGQECKRSSERKRDKMEGGGSGGISDVFMSGWYVSNVEAMGKR